ncbi:MAG: hypothetical protein HKL92_09100 [Candidatus Eremiobacteraeota bacterium]|nr:hypothetical protein [Candidatus Eremiobacteraeota bacterium]
MPALDAIGLRCLGALAREGALALPERHLGLVQAREQRELESFLEAAAAACESQLDIDALLALASRSPTISLSPFPTRTSPRDGGAPELGSPFFPPLADEGPEREADAVYLPGGYPELHAAKLAAATNFRAGMEAARARGAAIYGECGGYMVLGESLADRDAREHAMLGFLPLRFSFAQPRMHLGYREVRPLADTPFARAGAPLRGHEFHFASVEREPEGSALFETIEEGRGSLRIGMRAGNVIGSFLHLLDRLEA